MQIIAISGMDVELPNEGLPNIVPSKLERARIVASNPVASAQWFNILIDAILEFLVGKPHQGKPASAVLGEINGWYGVIDDQWRGTIHLHLIGYSTGLSPIAIAKALEDGVLRNHLISFLNSIVSATIPKAPPAHGDAHPPGLYAVPDPMNPDFEANLGGEVAFVVMHTNLHRHTFTCHPSHSLHSHPLPGREDCRLDYPHALQPETVVELNKSGEPQIFLQCDDPLLVAYNKWISLCERGNMEISVFGSRHHAKAGVFYGIFYMLKNRLSTNSIVAFVAAALENMEKYASGEQVGSFYAAVATY